MAHTASTPTVQDDRACADCVGALDHCHGTLIAHADLEAECTEPDCTRTDQARHARVLDCAELADCGCTYREQRFALAS